MRADDPADRARRVEISRSRSRTSSPRPRIGVERLDVVGQRQEELLDLLVDRRGQQRERLDARLLRRRSSGRSGSEREQRVHLRRHLAEPPQPRQERLGAVAPSERLEREVPAVAVAAGRSAAGSPSVASIGRPDVRRPSPRARRSCAKPRSVRKRSSSSSGLMPGLERGGRASGTCSSSKTIEVFDCSAPMGLACTTSDISKPSAAPSTARNSSAARRRSSASAPAASGGRARARAPGRRRVVGRPAVDLADHAVAPALAAGRKPSGSW